MNSSPFSDNRFELELRHLYFLQEEIYTTLQRTKPCFLIGSRGTGKTTLLRSLSWRERSNNEGLRAQFGKDTFSEFIGVYIKLPEVQLDGISIWLNETDDVQKRAIYSRYLELIQLQEIFDAVSELEVAGELQYSAALEHKVVKKLIDDFGDELYLNNGTSKPPTSFAELSSSTRMLRRFVEKASQQGTAPLAVLSALGSPAQLCNLSREVAKRLAEVISSECLPKVVFFKVCFDEAETLDSFGVQILATWVRLSTDPLYHVISFVSKPESLSETLVPNLTVQIADVEFIDLDNINDTQFRSFAEGVTTLRLKAFSRRAAQHLPIENVQPFSTERLFGKLNLNFLLWSSLRASESAFSKELLSKAALKGGGEEQSTRGRSSQGDDSALPIYETYLEMRTNRIRPNENLQKWSKRAEASQFIRKANVAAYLSIMHELKTTPKYAYADMILQLSDSCIRDFLNNIEFIYRKSKLSLPKFLEASKIKATIQSSGLLDASKAKVKSLPTQGVNHPSCTAKLVAGLGKLTQLLQCQSKDGVRHLKTTERGIFQLATSKNTESTKRAVTLIIDAAEAGFLKILPSDELLIQFRVHTSLAPAYSFSYRGAYYPVPVQTLDILALADAADDKEIERLAYKFFNRLDGVRIDDLFSEGDS